uniref:Pentatricopeptide repeat-containing protein n=1 Tax=Aegilops tauschii TaxID=37682 RepID=M8C8X8_AEGTA
MANTYDRCRQPGDARMVFDNMPVPDRVAWNALVVQYVRNGITVAAMALVVQMQDENGERPDSVMLVSPAALTPRSLGSAASLCILMRGAICENWTGAKCVSDEPCAPKCKMIDLAVGCPGSCKLHMNLELTEESTERIFELVLRRGMPVRDIVAWRHTQDIREYAHARPSCQERARCGVQLDSVMLVSMLPVCADALVLRGAVDELMNATTTIFDVYCKRRRCLIGSWARTLSWNG